MLAAGIRTASLEPSQPLDVSTQIIGFATTDAHDHSSPHANTSVDDSSAEVGGEEHDNRNSRRVYHCPAIAKFVAKM